MLTSACEQLHVEYINTRFVTPALNGRGENSVRTMKEMIQCQKESVDSLGFKFSIVHPLFALLGHSDWLVNHLVSSDFQVEAEERVIKTSPYENHTGNPAPVPTKLAESNLGWPSRWRRQTATSSAGLVSRSDWWLGRGDHSAPTWDTTPSWRMKGEPPG